MVQAIECSREPGEPSEPSTDTIDEYRQQTINNGRNGEYSYSIGKSTILLRSRPGSGRGTGKNISEPDWRAEDE